MSTVTLQMEDCVVDALHAYAEKVGKSVSQAVRDLLMPIISPNVENAQMAKGNPWSSFCGCIPKEEAEALRMHVAAQDTVDEEIWK